MQEEDSAGFEVVDAQEGNKDEGGDAVADDAPARISVYVTATKNPNRPRTLRAGYDSSRQVLTVVFRDGTWWNYYGVDRGDWESFRDAPSKGEWLHQSGYNHRQHGLGPGEMSEANAHNTNVNIMRMISRSSEVQKVLGGKQSRKLSGPRIEAARTRYIKGLGSI